MKLAFLLLYIAGLSLGSSLFHLQGRSRPPAGWRKLENDPSLHKKPISFTFNLRQCNLDKLDAAFWQVSNPRHERYGNYLTSQDINRMIACDGDKAIMDSFLAKYEIEKIIHRGNAIKVYTTVAVASEMLNTEFYEFEHKSGKIYIRQLGEVKLEKPLKGIVNFVAGISEFFIDSKFKPIAHKNERKKKINLPSEYNPNTIDFTDPYVTPALLFGVYGIDFSPINNEANSLGIAAFDNAYDQEALCRFQDLFNGYSLPPVVMEVGPEDGSDQIESDLDVQYSTAIAHGISSITFANHPPNEWILDWAQATVADDNRALVWSLSYGWPEVYQCELEGNQTGWCPTGYDFNNYIEATNQELKKLGSMGVSVMVSSGDDGTPGFADNCPFDPEMYYNAAQTNCYAQLEGGNCNCGELTITYKKEQDVTTCFLPNGFLEISECMSLSNAALGLCFLALQDFVSTPQFDSNNDYCNISSSFTQEALYFYSNCTCEDFQPVTKSLLGASCTISGYQFDIANGPMFLPDFPTTSPFVTSVGAVARQFSSECQPSVTEPEIYCQATEASGFSGGGGFSSVNPMPSYQEEFVSNYLSIANNLPPAVAFNASNRGYPDVSFNGHNYIVTLGVTAYEEGQNIVNSQGAILPISGTSASSPGFAGMVVQLNEYLLDNDMPPLGFLNQLLYQMASDAPETFTDITPESVNVFNMTYHAGTYSGCTQAYCCQYGFPVTKGWDPATGLGTPNYQEILDYIRNMWAKKSKITH